ncbi:hypothetical protein [Spirillospora sp. NPDC029432]|uniref:hypothetical protein n=1 Tax=Spirillospora sp. NPDC029432 TaxID=3154599 RepID=UPI0034553189
MTAYVFERVFGAAPRAVRHVPGALTLLDGLTVGLPWGVVAAAGPGPTGVHSMNHRAAPYTGGPAPGWAGPAVAALRAHGALESRVAVHRELPFATGLSSGAETFSAVSQALQDLYGLPPVPCGDPAGVTARHARPGEALLLSGEGAERLPCDLAAAGLRLLVMDPGAGRSLPSAPGHGERAAAALRAGDLDAFGAVLTSARTRGEPVFDTVLDAARAAGALGGLAVGRCAVALVPLEAVPAVRRRVNAALDGLAGRPPRFLTAVPSGPRESRAPGQSLGVNGRR